MSHGRANSVTLYDQEGNPVEVKLTGGSYALVVRDTTLEQVMVLLTEIRDELRRQYDFPKE